MFESYDTLGGGAVVSVCSCISLETLSLFGDRSTPLGTRIFLTWTGSGMASDSRRWESSVVRQRPGNRLVKVLVRGRVLGCQVLKVFYV